MSNIEINDLDELVNNRKKSINKKSNNQILYGLALIFLVSILLYKINKDYTLFLLVGVIIGFVLRYSRFCFASAFREPFVTGNTKALRAVIIALIISSIGFGLIQIGNKDIVGELSTTGIHTAIGAFIFGIGMVLAGGCASGLLMRLGEGHIIHLVVVLGFIIGSLLGAKDYGSWYKYIISDSKVIYFPNYMNIKTVLLLQILFLLLLYYALKRYEDKGK